MVVVLLRTAGGYTGERRIPPRRKRARGADDSGGRGSHRDRTSYRELSTRRSRGMRRRRQGGHVIRN
eukprot:5745861-Prymnesium_polylepis.1